MQLYGNEAEAEVDLFVRPGQFKCHAKLRWSIGVEAALPEKAEQGSQDAELRLSIPVSWVDNGQCKDYAKLDSVSTAARPRVV